MYLIGQLVMYSTDGHIKSVALSGRNFQTINCDVSKLKNDNTGIKNHLVLALDVCACDVNTSFFQYAKQTRLSWLKHDTK